MIVEWSLYECMLKCFDKGGDLALPVMRRAVEEKGSPLNKEEARNVILQVRLESSVLD